MLHAADARAGAASRAVPAQSQITVVVTVAAGGSSDIGLRTIAAKVEQMGGPKIVVENRPGGGGVTGNARREGCGAGRAHAAARELRHLRRQPGDAGRHASTIRSPTSSRSRRCSRSR